MSESETLRWTVLVEGESDRAAVETLARRRGLALDGSGVAVVALGGAQALGRHLAGLGQDVHVVGLCDANEERAVARALERAGVGRLVTRDDLERAGFYVCEADLEDELIRAVGVEGVEAVLDANGDLGAFRTFQRQPQWQGRPVEAQLRRHFGASAGKIKYAPLLAEALDLERVPPPLEKLLDRVSRS